MTPKERLAHLYRLHYLLEEYCDPFVTSKPPSVPLCTPLDTLKNMATSCHLCTLSKGRTQVVFGRGFGESLMIIGDWPSQEDDRSGLSLGGKTGESVVAMVEQVIGISMNDVYLTTLVKCKPALTNNPTSTEWEQCFPYLEGEIDALSPRLILTLGEAAFQTLCHTSATLSSQRGVLHHYKTIPVIPTYHPTFLARNPSEKVKVKEDLLKVKALLQGSSQ